jgi:hypothetical protein
MTESEKSHIAILKSMWRKDDAGKWVIHDMKGIDLKPREGFSRDYYRVKDEFVLLTQAPGPVMNNIFSSFGWTEFILRQSVVPVIAWNEGDEEIRCIGTGFFISATGLLLTAAHVLRDPIDEGYAGVTEVAENRHRLSEKLHFGVLLPTNPAMRTAPFVKLDRAVRDAKWLMCPFEWALHWGKEHESPLVHEKPEFRLQIDLAVCKVRENVIVGSYQPLNIGLHNLAVGNRAVAIGYAEMRNIRTGGDDYEPELYVSVGAVTNIYRDNITEKHNPTPGPNFEFDATIPGKMSGSPIVVGEGIITKGVVSRSLGSGERHATGCLIAPMMSLPLIDGKSLIDLQRSGTEGISQFIARGL